LEKYLLLGIGALALINCVLLVMLLLRRNAAAIAPLEPVISQLEKLHERTERIVREDIGQNRNEGTAASRQTREELNAGLKTFADALFRQMGQIATLQKGQLDTFSNQLTSLTQTNEQKLEAVRQTVEAKLTQMAHDAADHATKGRDEDKRNFDGFCQLLIGRITEVTGQQKQQLVDLQVALKALMDSNNVLLVGMRDTVDRKLGHMQTEATQNNAANREEAGKNLKAFGESLLLQTGQIAALQKQELEKFSTAVGTLTQANEQKLEKVRETVEARLTALQTDNSAKLEAMRQTVDEKLHATLEQRLGESFKIVSERLELVHKGLGEMQSLAHGVGDLKKVLSNIKTRGNWGEVQLGNLLEQLLTPDQYAANVQTNPQTMDRVEYAIKLPGKDTDGKCVWLPIDAKFPQSDYERLVDAAENGDAETIAACSAALEAQICGEAKKIKTKYINPPNTTDFAILFLPTEGLFAEILRRPGLYNGILHDHRVVVAGPTTLSAVLSSLQMGFRTLAIEKRSSEVWQVLGAVKTEFGKFGDVLDKVHKKLQEASNTIETAQTRKRAVERTLRDVEVVTSDSTDRLAGPIGISDNLLQLENMDAPASTASE
jgi:DNA recombination protein RmuC